MLCELNCFYLQQYTAMALCMMKYTFRQKEYMKLLKCRHFFHVSLLLNFLLTIMYKVKKFYLFLLQPMNLILCQPYKHCISNSAIHSACSESVGGPSGAARGRQPQFRRAHGDGRKSLRPHDDVAAATKRRTTSRLTVCGTQLGTSGRFPHPSNYFRWITSTSGRGLAPQTEPRSMPAREVQRFRHSAIVFGHLPGISHFPSPKWRLKLLPVPVLTRNLDFPHPVSY